jgi:glycosyltransferase involved in cell wall biosynthesis
MGKKILIVQRFYYNFREGFFEYLVDKGIDFSLINSTTPRGKVKIHADVKNKAFIEKAFYFFRGDSYVIFPFLFFKMIFINPRIIITEGGQNTINNISVFLYSKIFRKKYIVWDLGKGYADFGNSFMRSVYMKIYKSILKSARYVFGYNSQSKSYFNSLGINEEKIIVLNNTIDTRKIAALRGSYTPYVPEELKDAVKNNYTFLVFVGALVGSKNIESLGELMKMLGSRYYLILVGEGKPDYVKELEKQFAGINYIFVGYKRNEQLFPYYGVSSFAILPGLGGLSINQAMACGVPVVCRSADGAEKDLVIDNETGYIYNDLDDASNFIVSKSKDEWSIMGQKAEDLLYSKHSVESMMDKFIHFSTIK